MINSSTEKLISICRGKRWRGGGGGGEREECSFTVVNVQDFKQR